MDIPSLALLLFAGISGGVITALAGGASIITFPILLATGINPISAAVTNTVSLTPSNIMAAYTERSQFPPLGRSFVPLLASSVVATLVGGALLTLTPERMFAKLIPLLLGFATVLIAQSERIAAWVKARDRAVGKDGPGWSRSIVWLVPVSVYGGYFGAGLGVLMLGVLSIGTAGDYRSANVVKNLVVGLSTAVLAVFFFAQQMVAIPHVFAIMTGSVIGGVVGGRIAKRVPNEASRRLVVAMGTLLTVTFAWRYWL